MLSASRVAVPIRPNADEPIHETSCVPSSASRGPRSMPPGCSSARRLRSGLRTTFPAIPWASLTIRPANEAPGTTIRNSARATTSPAASFGCTRCVSHWCTGANTAYRTGIPRIPVAYGESATTSAAPNSKMSSAARWWLVSRNGKRARRLRGRSSHDPLHEPAGLEGRLELDLIDQGEPRDRDGRGPLARQLFDRGAPVRLEDRHPEGLHVERGGIDERGEAPECPLGRGLVRRPAPRGSVAYEAEHRLAVFDEQRRAREGAAFGRRGEARAHGGKPVDPRPCRIVGRDAALREERARRGVGTRLLRERQLDRRLLLRADGDDRLLPVARRPPVGEGQPEAQ